MSYFDDNEDHIIYGWKGSYMARGIGRAKPKDEGYDVGKGDLVEVTRVSDKAVEVRTPDKNLVWFPFSQIHPDSDITEDNCAPEYEGQLIVTTWIADKKNLLGDPDTDEDGF